MALCAFVSKKQKGFWAAALSFIGGTLLSGGAAFGLSYLLNADMLAVPGGFFTSGLYGQKHNFRPVGNGLKRFRAAGAY